MSHRMLWLALTLVAVAGCATLEPPYPRLPDDALDAERRVFTTQLIALAGPTSTDCGTSTSSRSDPQGIACVRGAWTQHQAFRVMRELHSGFCPNFTAYASDASGHVFLVESCPERDHARHPGAAPTVQPCPEFLPPKDRWGDGRCSILESV